ncbi:MAG: arsenosugar biosynthesis-associated peroxidase-like protein [Coriobacteriia bacterium]|nr:arsenosugar biosynthesis-associated peroxidase-like protein [Coriobacteriia bacterium]
MATYYEEKDLNKFPTMGEDAPELWEKFIGYYGPALQDGALSSREKALIGLAVAAAIQCPYCIDSFTQSCLQKGVSSEEMTEVFHAASAVRAGATLAHGVQMKNIVKNLEM